MLITFLILKLTFQSILNECNKLALEQQSKEEIRQLKSRLLKIRLEYETGRIDETTYNTKQNEILRELKGISG
ncbi:hypothetical protein DYY67_1991 [Candidatus Nitrosotalea sp. TS]|uniref:hypothetical protein n=1 Tax=Candidatus Nitrosotalea sp. TS TaxID=2341020 RepID=UPI00140BBCA1|nr:hypothetical protein [Candidatus Nitrosotalea sp. TS]NHI02309.1 hypothetical protein [Candidatus Nitrosotalea sp. TS]